MKFVIANTPNGTATHLLVRVPWMDYDLEDPREEMIETTACGLDPSLLNTPELGEAQIVYQTTLPADLCANCRQQYDLERQALQAWNARVTQKE